MAEPETPPERPGSSSEDIAAIRRKVEAARVRTTQSEAFRPSSNAASLAMRFGGEFGAALIVGGLVGYGLDVWLHSSPIGLAAGLGIGFVAGVVNIVRVAKSYSARHPPEH